MSALSEHNSDTGKYTIYAAGSGTILITGTAANWHEYHRIEAAIRRAERIAAERSREALSDTLEAALRTARRGVR